MYGLHFLKHSSIDTYLRCFYILTILMLQLAWKCRYLHETMILSPLGIRPEEEFLDRIVVLFLISLGNSIMSFVRAKPIYNSMNSVQVFTFFHTLADICYLLCFDYSYLQVWRDLWSFHVCLPVVSDVEHIFIYLLVIFMSSLWTYLFRLIKHFKIFFCYWVVN